MKYTLFIEAQAEDELAAIWLAATDRDRVTAASDDIDRELESDPLNAGESRSSSLDRVAIRDGLLVEYHVVVDDRSVHIYHFRSSRKSNR